MSKRLVLFMLICFSIISPLTLKASFPKSPEKPRLVVRIVVEQMRYEMLLRYWGMFDDGGFKKLVNEGVLCKNVQIDYSNVERSSGFASIATGAYPSGHGIIADRWYNRLNNEQVFCIDDGNYESLGGENGNYSPENLLASTTGDEMKLMNDASKVYSIALNPVSSVLGTGKMSDGAFWFDDKSGNWMTNTYFMDSLPQWVRDFNAKNLESSYMNRHWETFLPDSNYTRSTVDENEAEDGFPLLYKRKFPYNLKVLRDKSYSFKYLKYTPFGNTYTNDFAVSLILNERLGKDNHTDLVNLAFSSSSYVNELFGPRSVEMEDLFLRLDQQISHFLGFLEQEFGKDHVLVVLTSDRGSADLYEFRKQKKLQAGKFNPSHGLALLNAYLNIVYKKADWVNSYTSKQLYFDHSLIDLQGYDINDLQETVSRFMVKKAGIAYAVKASTLQNNHFSEGMLRMMQNSYHPKRSGDVMFAYEPGIIEVPFRFGSIYNYDTHVPMIWWGNGFSNGVINEEVHIRDVAPTISHILNIPLTDVSTGNKITPLIGD